MNKKIIRYSSITILTTLLTACASSGGGNGGNWQSIGSSSNGNIKIFIDQSSIQKSGQLVTFRDKKVVSKASEESFANMPQYKTAISTWEIHCANKTYRLNALQLINEQGKVIANEKYTATSLRPMSVMNGTVTEKQYEQVCNKKL